MSAEPAAPPTGKYVPPAARARAQAQADGLDRLADFPAQQSKAGAASSVAATAGRNDDEEADTLNPTTSRRVRGLLNKLTEQNIGGVSGELAEVLGGSGSRATCAALARLMLGSCVSESQLLAPLVLLHAAFARALSIRLGQNVLTALVEAAVLTFERATPPSSGGGSASAQNEASEHARSNCALLLAHLYNLGGLHATLLYELVRKLVAAFGGALLLPPVHLPHAPHTHAQRTHACTRTHTHTHTPPAGLHASKHPFCARASRRLWTSRPRCAVMNFIWIGFPFTTPRNIHADRPE